MPYFVVINEQGPAWDEKRSMRGQKGWDEHAVFMEALADEHFVVLGGPLKYLKHRAMLVLNAPNEVVLRNSLKTLGCAPECFAPSKSILGKFSLES